MYSRLCCILLPVLFVLCAARAQNNEPWPDKYYNPQPAADDFILPMPCGGFMVFRAVDVPSAGWLDDIRVELGQADPATGYKEGRRFSYIAGAFTDKTNTSRRFFYLAKYETTQDQFAVFSAQCRKPTRKGQLPAIDVSWFDAVDFSRRYNEWLLQNAAEHLPSEEQESGYLRLPTEVEWEFAARGGLKVDKTAFVATLFPMPEGDITQYAWFQGTQSAAGKLHPVGLLKPNPLGLYDVLGNVAEMVFVPFHLDHRGRAHGQAGGFISKGGHLFTSRSQLRTAARDEHPYFDRRTGQARRSRSLGFRLVLTAPVIVSHERLQSIVDEWSLLPDPAGDTGKETRQALAALDTVTQETEDDTRRAELELVKRDLEKAYAANTEARNRAVKALIRMGAFLGNKVRTDKVRVDSIDNAINLARTEFENLRKRITGRSDAGQILAETEEKLAKMENARAAVHQSLANSLSYYGDMVIDVAGDYTDDTIIPQLQVLKLEFEAKQSQYLIAYADVFVNHINVYQKSGRADTDKWLEDILQ